jgi:hypothetical protein
MMNLTMESIPTNAPARLSTRKEDLDVHLFLSAASKRSKRARVDVQSVREAVDMAGDVIRDVKPGIFGWIPANTRTPGTSRAVRSRFSFSLHQVFADGRSGKPRPGLAELKTGGRGDKTEKKLKDQKKN